MIPLVVTSKYPKYGVMGLKTIIIALLLVAAMRGQPLCEPKIVTSIYPLTSIARSVGGSKVTVTTLVPRGADPHNFELPPSAVAAIDQADRVFLIGGRFDTWFIDIFREEKREKLVALYEAFDDSLISLGIDFNPHIWLDPLMAKQIAKIMATHLKAIAPSESSYFEDRLEAFSTQLDSLNEWIKQTLAEIGFSEFVGLHPAWSYFARRYGLNERATIEISHEYEPSPRHIAEVIKTIRTMKSRCILAEEFSNPSLARAVASATGATVLILDPLGGPDLDDRSTYMDLLKYNVKLIVERCTREDAR